MKRREVEDDPMPVSLVRFDELEWPPDGPHGPRSAWRRARREWFLSRGERRSWIDELRAELAERRGY